MSRSGVNQQVSDWQMTKIKRHTSLPFDPYEVVLHHMNRHIEFHQYNVSSLRMDAMVAALCQSAPCKSGVADLVGNGKSQRSVHLKQAVLYVIIIVLFPFVGMVAFNLSKLSI